MATVQWCPDGEHESERSWGYNICRKCPALETVVPGRSGPTTKSAQSLACLGDSLSPKIGDVLQRKKLSTTIGASNFAYLHNMVKAGRAESVGQAVDKAVEIARKLDNRATLERQTTAYFKGLTSQAAAEETDLEDALSAASQEMNFDQP
jgi:hypothetical protein